MQLPLPEAAAEPASTNTQSKLQFVTERLIARFLHDFRSHVAEKPFFDHPQISILPTIKDVLIKHAFVSSLDVLEQSNVCICT